MSKSITQITETKENPQIPPLLEIDAASEILSDLLKTNLSPEIDQLLVEAQECLLLSLAKINQN